MTIVLPNWQPIGLRLILLFMRWPFLDKNELKGAYMNTSRKNFANTMTVSAYSFTEVARAASSMMPSGGALVTLSFRAQRTPNYNVMGVAKAALEASVRYLAVDLGGQNIRVNALSPGQCAPLPVLQLQGLGIFFAIPSITPLQRNPGLEEGRAGLYLLSDLSSGVTGEVHFVDGGCSRVGIPGILMPVLTTKIITQKRQHRIVPLFQNHIFFIEFQPPSQGHA